jgi:hypothetical protein
MPEGSEHSRKRAKRVQEHRVSNTHMVRLQNDAYEKLKEYCTASKRRELQVASEAVLTYMEKNPLPVYVESGTQTEPEDSGDPSPAAPGKASYPTPHATPQPSCFTMYPLQGSKATRSCAGSSSQ